MRIKELHSLLWLSKWHNGNAVRLYTQLQRHMAVLSQLVQQELAGRTLPNPVELNLCGIQLLCEVEADSVRLIFISPPDRSTGVQKNLFTLAQRPRQRETQVQLAKRRSRTMKLLPAVPRKRRA